MFCECWFTIFWGKKPLGSELDYHCPEAGSGVTQGPVHPYTANKHSGLFVITHWHMTQAHTLTKYNSLQVVTACFYTHAHLSLISHHSVDFDVTLNSLSDNLNG
jgi:hypothetical protein